MASTGPEDLGLQFQRPPSTGPENLGPQFQGPSSGPEDLGPGFKGPPGDTDAFQENDADTRYGRTLCYNLMGEARPGDINGWEGSYRLGEALPILVTQLFVANFTYRVIYHLIRPLRLPPFVAQILCGLLFSPTILGNTKWIQKYVFPNSAAMVLETFANFALVYNVFLLGLGMDLRMIKIKELKPVIIAIVCIVVTLPAGAAIYYIPGNGNPDKIVAGCFYWSVALACTNFPDLARVLADLKLLRTDMGHTAMCAAVISDLCTWIFLVLLFGTFGKGEEMGRTIVYTLTSTIAFVFLCIYGIRPGLVWAFKNTIKGGHYDDSHVWYTLIGVVICSLISELCGVSSITGAFMFGLSIPNDNVIRNMIEEKLHDFLAGILMPLFYIICGLRTDVFFMLRYTSFGMVVLVIFLAFMVKVVSTVVCSIVLRMPLRDGFALALLMNTKGTLALVVLNSGRDTKGLDVIMYTHMTLAFLVMSIIVQPLLFFTYKKKKSVLYKNRTIQNVKGESELRVLACVHVLPNVSGITNLLQISNPTKQSPLNVYAIHLVELTGRTTASLLIMNDEAKPKDNFSDRVRAESEQIAEAFEAMEVNNDSMTIQTITAVSPYATMHEDIATLAEDKRVSFIILPYHKGLTSDGRLDDGNSAHADINLNVMSHAPCSVGIIVDRGMTIFQPVSTSSRDKRTRREVAMLFTSGPDDREALAYAWRMVGEQQESLKLTVMRFVPSQEALSLVGKSGGLEYQKQSQVDEEFIYEFNFKTMNNSWVTYTEKVVNNCQETVMAIREMEDEKPYDLYIVGRGHNVETPVTSGLTDWSSITPDLGTLGDTLVSSNFTMQASILVIQQYSSADNNQENVEGRASTKNEASPFMQPHGDDDEESEQYQRGMRK